MRTCGVTHDALVVAVDVRKGSLDIERVLEGIETVMETLPPQLDIRRIKAELEKAALYRGVWLTDVATLRIESRQGECTVMGPGAPPTLVIWASPEGVANATRLLQATPGVRVFADGPVAVVGTTLSPIDRRTAMQRWLARDRSGSVWLVQDDDDPAWLLADATTTLRSFSEAATHELHVWWSDAPSPVTAHICGEELDAIRRAANAFTAAGFDDLLDDVAVWSPRNRSYRSFAIDHAAVAAHGLTDADVARLAPFVIGERLALRDDVAVSVPWANIHTATLTLAGTSGAAPITKLGAEALETEPAFIAHIDRARCVTVDLQPRRAEDRARIEEILRDRIELPAGVRLAIPPR